MMKKTTKATKTIKVGHSSSVNVNEISLYELCRWASLKDAVDLLGDKCEEKRIKFESIKLDPLAIMKFVDHQSDHFYNNVLENQKQEPYYV